jgi:EAL domain-containing protein (putative c-di-GMP-specific phosphodiesterase class I)
VKIDKCFISRLGCSSDAELIVRAMIVLGRSLGLTVAAEGVENEAQLAFLAAEGCHTAQGFHLAPPLPPAELAKLWPHGTMH